MFTTLNVLRRGRGKLLPETSLGGKQLAHAWNKMSENNVRFWQFGLIQTCRL